MTLLDDVRTALSDADNVPNLTMRSDRPPFVTARFTGQNTAELLPTSGAPRMAADVWVCVTIAHDPEDTVRDVWSALEAGSGMFPVAVVGFTESKPPGSKQTYDGAIIRVEQT